MKTIDKLQTRPAQLYGIGNLGMPIGAPIYFALHYNSDRTRRLLIELFLKTAAMILKPMVLHH